MTSTSPIINNLSPKQLETLLRRLGQSKTVPEPQPRIVRAPHSSPNFELSFPQERLWIAEQLAPGLALYNMSGMACVSGQLDLRLWARTLNMVLERHEILRSTYILQDGQPRCIVVPSICIQPRILDATGQSDEEIRGCFSAEARTPFDLSQGPLIRCTVARQSEQRFFILLTMHHIVADGMSTRILFQECGSIYSALKSGRPPRLPELAVQYCDFARFQRQDLQCEMLERQLAYWKRKLEGVPTVLELPTDSRRPSSARHVGVRQPIRLNSKLTTSLRELSKREGVTLFVTLMAGFATVLSRYTRQHDFVIGVPVSGRQYPELRDLIGCFLNTLPARVQFETGPTFRELFAQLKSTTLDAFSNQDVPFERIVEALNVERIPGVSPLVQAMFSLEASSMGDFSPPGLDLAIQFEEVDTATSKTDLTLELTEEGVELAGWLEYDADLFNATTIANLAGYLESVLQQMVRDPEQRTSAVRLMKRTDTLRAIHDWNDTAADYPSELSIKQLFERQAVKTPANLAVLYGGRRLTYCELNERANQVAHYLQRKGVRPGDLVGLLIQRSLEFIVATVGIAKAGAAYVPLDPDYPAERLQMMIADAELATILTIAESSDRLPCYNGSLLTIEDCGTEPNAGNLDLDIQGNDAAYVMYTSGSTGKPKGILIPHRGITRLVINSNYAQLTPQDRVAQVSNICFDAATFEMWGALLNGAALVGINKDVVLNPRDFAIHLQNQQISAMFLTSSLFNRMAADQPGAFSGLNHLLAGGEALDVQSVKRVVTHPKRPRRFLNGYGPTESTTFAACYEVSEIADGDICIPIGKPISNTTIYVLDESMELTPTGAIGEIYIGADGLAHGYLRRPELTAEKFIPDPYAAKPGARLYRTGDLARQRSDGTIEFLGRIDDQVKIRGFRIEPAEIEAVLRAHEGLRECAVTVSQEAGRKRLIAYVALHPDVEVSTIRHYLRSKLPEYMLPSALVTVDKLPLNSNGKLDRRALPSPETPRTCSAASKQVPQDALQILLARIWCTVLNVPSVGITDNFFDLGGDSIMAIQVAARANQEGVALTPAQLIEHQTIAAVSAVATQQPASTAEQGPVIGEAPLSPIQHWFFQSQPTDRHHWNQAVMLEMSQQASPQIVRAAFDAIVHHHDALRLRFDFTQTKVTQSFGGVAQLPFQVENVSHVSDDKLAEELDRVAARAHTTLDLTNGPIFRIVWFDCGIARPARLLIVIHHLAVDGISWRILLEDLETAFEQLVTGSPIKLPAKSSSFKEWTTALQNYAHSPETINQLPYWQSQSSIDSKDDFQAVTHEHSDTVSHTLKAESTAELLRRAPHAYRTSVDEILLTALTQTWARQCNEAGLVVNLEGHGREQLADRKLDVSRTVGWFTSLSPVRLELNPQRPCDIEASLKNVKEQLRGRPMKGLGYGLLRYLNVEGAFLDRLPQPKISFNYLGQLDTMLDRAKWFRMARESVGPTRGLRTYMAHEIEIDAVVMNGCLQVNWTYSKHAHSRDAIEALATSFVSRLEEIIAHCVNPESAGFTPSDFPLAKLNAAKLNRIEKVLARKSIGQTVRLRSNIQ